MNWKRAILALIAVGATSLFAGNEIVKADAWQLNKVWTMKDGKISVLDKGGSFLLLKKKSMLTEMEFEAEITPVKVEGAGWKCLGIGLYKAPTVFWQFAFIESPDKNTKRHFVELKCKKDKVWGHENKLKLKRLKAQNFKWEYGKTYKFKLKLTSERIDGIIYAKDSDKPLAHIAYALKDGAVKTGMPALRCVQMKATFSEIEVKGK
jgi:hypothetical protein